MISQLDFYQKKICRAGEIDPEKMLLLAQDDKLLACGNTMLLPLGGEILQTTGSTSVFIGLPLFPYLELLFSCLPESVACAVPLDTETRTFLHDIPLIRNQDFRVHGAAVIAAKLRQRKGVLVEGLGLVAVGAMTIEQGYVNFCSLLHATVVKVLLDLLREPLPNKALLERIAPLLDQVSALLPLDTHGLEPFDPQSPSQILQAIDTAGCRMVELGLVDSFFGNISVAMDQALYISQTAASLDRLPGCVDLVLHDDSSCVGLTASSELAAHRAIFEKTAARIILHGHPRFSVILSLLCEEECQTEDCWKDCDKVRDLHGVPVVAGEVGAGGLVRNLPPVIGICQLALVYGHGVFAIGQNDFSVPLAAMLHFENWCRSHYMQRLQQRIA